VCSSVLHCVAVCCSVLQCVAVCGSMLQCVAECCSMCCIMSHCLAVQAQCRSSCEADRGVIGVSIRRGKVKFVLLKLTF